MEGLELKYLAPYLPYKVRYKRNNNKAIILKRWDEWFKFDGVKLILRPLDLNKSIEVDGNRFIPILELTRKLYQREPESFNNEKSCQIWLEDHLSSLKESKGYDNILHWIFQDLIKWHFDLFGLYDKGLCIYYDEI